MRKLTFILIALMLTVSTTVFAQRGRQGARQGAGRQVELTEEQKAVLEKAKLTDEQQEQIKALRTEAQKDRVRIQADLKIAKIELSELKGKENVSESAMKSQLEKIKSYEVDLQMENFKHQKAVNSLLTDEQKEAREQIRKFQKARGNRSRIGRAVNRRQGQGAQGIQRNARRENPGSDFPMQRRSFRRGIGDGANMPVPAGKMSGMMHDKNSPMLRHRGEFEQDDEWMADIDWLFEEYPAVKAAKKIEKDRKNY
ncbi:Spy/CpxP family protein refolding chaperone [candidate division KSB1 bacterium]